MREHQRPRGRRGIDEGPNRLRVRSVFRHSKYSLSAKRDSPPHTPRLTAHRAPAICAQATRRLHAKCKRNGRQIRDKSSGKRTSSNSAQKVHKKHTQGAPLGAGRSGLNQPANAGRMTRVREKIRRTDGVYRSLPRHRCLREPRRFPIPYARQGPSSSRAEPRSATFYQRVDAT